jgi:hypothetical protein
MDGLPGLRRGVETAKREDVKPIKKMVGPFAPTSAKKSANRLASTSPVFVALSSFFVGMLVTFLLLEFLCGDLRGDIVNYSEEIRSLLK